MLIGVLIRQPDKSRFFLVYVLDTSPNDEQCEDGAPDNHIGASDPRVRFLKRGTHPIRKGPESKARTALDIVFGDEPKETAITTHGMVVSKYKIVVVGDRHAKGTNEIDIELALFERGAVIFKSNIR